MAPLSQSSQSHDFLVVANRLPVDVQVQEDDSLILQPSPGGLVAALSPVLAATKGGWVGWPGVTGLDLDSLESDEGYVLHPVSLSAEEYENFYEGFSNATLWPLYHDLIVPPVYNRRWWESYLEVNQRFADVVDTLAAPGATVWVQDYQLQLVPGLLRAMRSDLKIGFFFHIPFPGADLFRQLPWRKEIVEGVLGADLIGFHLQSSVDNFVSAARSLTNTDLPNLGAFPISIDPASLGPSNPEAARGWREELGNPELLLLGVDRLDYTKGILQRVEALEELFEEGVLDPSTTSFVQIATPSRERVEHYQKTRSALEEAVGRINGRFGSIGRPVVHYQHKFLPKPELRRLYEAADIMLVTPFKDGMNLVAKEYVACHPDGSGTLVLSEFAGAAEELAQAQLCNPFDVVSIKRSIAEAAEGLKNNPQAMTDRMKTMNEQVRTWDVAAWSKAFLSKLEEGKRK